MRLWIFRPRSESVRPTYQNHSSPTNPDTLRQIFHVATWIALVTICFGIFFFVSPSDRFPTQYGILVMGSGTISLIGLQLATLYLNRGETDQAVRLILYMVMGTQTIGSLLSSEGFYDPYIFAPTFTMIIAGFFLSNREMWMVANVSVIMVTALFILERSGLKTTPHPLPATYQLFLYASFMYTLYWALNSSIGYLRSQTRMLDESRAELEQQKALLRSEVKRQTADLSQLLKEKNAFLSMLTHDMKSPLTTIGLFAELVKSRPELIQQKPDLVDSAIQSKETLFELVNNILDIERLQTSGGISLDKKRFNLSDCIQRVVETYRLKGAKRNIAITYTSSTEPVFYNGDEHQLYRVLSNLLSNALKYSPDDVEIGATLTTEEDKLVIEVRDQGFGIAKDEQPHIFDRYYRVQAHSEIAKGTGLGLAVVQSIVDAHQGCISVESAVGEGSRFRVELPRKS